MKADKLVVKGSDGLYYKLNMTAEKVEAQQTDENSLNGSVIAAKSITATKIAVDDLVAFGATIGGFNIKTDALYSGVKASADNTTRGVYMDREGQFSVGDSNNFLRYFRDPKDGKYKLEVSAASIKFGSSSSDLGTTLEDAITSSYEEFYMSDSPTALSGGSWSKSQPVWQKGKYIWRRNIVTRGDGSVEYTPSEMGVCITGNTGEDGKDSILLHIVSSNGNMFKNSNLSTTLMVTIVVGDKTITSSREMHGQFGPNATIEWEQKLFGQEAYTKIDPNDRRLSDGATGPTGSPGAVGQGVSSITTQFYVSTSKTSQTGGSWVETMPTWSVGKYLWTRSKIIYVNPSKTVYTAPICDSSWEAVNDIQVGGRNLIIGSGGTGHDYFPGNGTKINSGYLGNKAVATNKAWNGYYIKIQEIAKRNNFKNGIVVTASVYVSVDSTAEVTTPNLWLYRCGRESAYSFGIHRLIKDRWVRLVTTYEINDISQLKNDMRFECQNDTAYNILWSCPKIEIGNKATDWTPAPEDIQSDIEQVRTDYKAELNVEKERISSTVSKVEIVEKTANSANSKIDGLSIGGRNLIKDTNQGVTGWGWSMQKGDYTKTEILEDEIKGAQLTRGGVAQTGWSVIMYRGILLNLLKPSTKYVVSFEVKSSAATTFGVDMIRGNATDRLTTGKINMGETVANKWTKLSCTLTTVDTLPPISDQVLYLTDMNSAVGVSYCFRNLKLEEGNKPTDWTPAPEDIESGINDAQASADKAQGTADSAYNEVTIAKTSIQQLSDSISHLVTGPDGSSLMTQTGNGWQFNMAPYLDTLNKASNGLTAVQGDVNRVESLANQTKNLANKLDQKMSYVTIGSYNGQPCIELGTNQGDVNKRFKLRITNTSIDFMEGSNRIAYISNQKLYIQSSVVTDQMQIGEGHGFIWKKRANGNLGLRRIG